MPHHVRVSHLMTSSCLRRYKRKSVEVGVFRRGLGYFELKGILFTTADTKSNKTIRQY